MNQTNDIFTPLSHNCNHEQEILKQKVLFSIDAVLTWNILNTFILIVILGS